MTLGASNAISDICTQTNGAVFTQAYAAGVLGAIANCSASATKATAASQSADPDVPFVEANAAAVILSGTPFNAVTL